MVAIAAGGATESGPAEADGAGRRAVWLGGGWPWRGYALALSAMAALDLLLWGAFTVMAGTPAAILLRLPETLGILVGLNLAGGWALFAPIRRHLRGQGPAEAARARLAVLAVWTGWWVTGVSAVFAVSSFLVTPFVIYGLAPTADIIAILLARAATWCVLLPYVAYFLAADHIRRLRRLMFLRDGLCVPPGGASLGMKLAAIMAGGAVAPGLGVAATLALVPPVSPITGQPRELLIVVALLGAGVALAVAFWAMRRSLDSSLGALIDAMGQVQAGRRDVRLAVQTDDELGWLAEHFNALTATLADSEAQGRRADAERQGATDRFHEAQKHAALGRLAGGIAHDFNNILAIIIGYADVARKRIDAADRNHARLGEIVRAADRGKALIAQILAFTRARAPERVRLDLRASVAETLDWLDATVGRGVRLERALPDRPLWVLGDATGVHQVLANLCVNAGHAMRGRDGAVRVTLEAVTIDGGRADGLRARIGAGDPAVVVDDSDPGRPRAFVGILGPGRHARLTVADDGCGMTAAVLRHVFEPYFTTKPVGEGTGLGLAAVLGIVTQHDGAISLESRPGDGAVFRIFLPLIGED